MNTLEMAVLAIRRSERWLQGAERALEDARWDDAVFSAQMCSEHAAKWWSGYRRIPDIPSLEPATRAATLTRAGPRPSSRPGTE